MFEMPKMPESILSKIAGMAWSNDDVGMSNSTVMLFDNAVLKIEKVCRSSVNEVKLLQWLDGRFPVPKIIESAVLDGYSYLLMERLRGEMACSERSLRNAGETVKALAKCLRRMWDVDVRGCPCTNLVAEKLEQARYNIDNGLVETDELDEDTIGEGGFADIEDLFRFLDQNRPLEDKGDLVFSHGDFCLPNVFIDGAEFTGILDIGNGGVASKWQDIALCVRSLRYNFVYCAGNGEQEFLHYKGLLFKELGIEPDEEKIRYYILMDELF